MTQQTAQELLKIITPELTWLLLQGFGALILFNAFKSFSLSILTYIKLRFSLWGLNTKLKVNGHVGYIKQITFREIIIYVDSNQTIYIPIEKFLNSEKIVYHNGYMGERK
jgi:hypothetical protein